ncbi:sugar phosphate isomerase/epimerase family protein [Shinella sp. S4-D37]|uniref:sugar phosphate isomerase/epimerase family protein n=1 Tax=Shinella sp. S4-D37 TaxID=3161999 RepID=UPI00346784CF
MANANYAINIYGFTFTHTAERAARELSDLGFNCIELMMYPGHLWPPEMDAGQRASFKTLLNERNMTVRSVNQPNVDINIAAAAPEMREHSLKMVGRMVETAGEYGADYVILGPGKVNGLMAMSSDKMMEHLYRGLDHLVPMAQKYNTQILVENMPFAFIPDVESLMQAVDGYGSDDVGVIYDLANGAFVGEDALTSLRRCESRLKLIHVSDTGSKIYRHDPIGQGTMDFALLGRQLAEFGWKHAPVLEVIGHSDDPGAEMVASARKLDALGWDKINPS